MIRANKIVCLLLVLLFITVGVQAFRVSRPPTLSFPLDEVQVSQLNDSLEEIWNITLGEYTHDIVTTTKTNANNGDMWMIQTGSTVYIQYKANNHIFTITPDGF